MKNSSNGARFGELFKKYRLRAEIETLAEFGDLLAEEGIVYENSLFTRWQSGDRVPRDRKTLIAMLSVFAKKDVLTVNDANVLLEVCGQGYLTNIEKKILTRIREDSDTKILQASLGGLLKDYRIQKGLSQIDFCIKVGWRNTNMLEAIEIGKEKPLREIIDHMCQALDLKDEEKNYLLYIGGYLPTEEEIQSVRFKTRKILDEWEYPAVLLDFSWRILSDNGKNREMHNISLAQKDFIQKMKPRIIELQINSNFLDISRLSSKDFEEWKDWFVKLLTHFRYSQQNHTKEKWYTDFLSRMLQNDFFHELWLKSMAQKKETIATKHGQKTFLNREGDIEELKLHFFVVPLMIDPRFEIEFYTPANLETFLYFRK